MPEEKDRTIFPPQIDHEEESQIGKQYATFNGHFACFLRYAGQIF